MAFTLTPAYSWSDGDLVTAVRLASTATPTLANGQTYTFGAGTAALPSWNFTGYTTTGLYAAAPGIGFSVAGASVGTWTATGLAVTGVQTISGSGSIGLTMGTTSALASLELYGGDSSASAAGRINNYKSRAGGVITTGDILFQTIGYGHDGTGYIESGALSLRTIGTIGTNRVASQWQFSTHPDSTSADALVATIDSTGLALASGMVLTLGNAYQAGAPTSTGYITIKDSTGTTYKIPASV